MMRLKPMVKSNRTRSKANVLLMVFACIMAVMLVVPPTTAYAAQIKYDNCNEKNITDITSTLVNKGIIKKRTVTVPSGYTNGKTTIDKDSFSFYGCQNKYVGTNRVEELYLDTSKVKWDGVTASTFTWEYVPQVGMGSNQVPIFYAIKKGGDKGWWMGARGMNRVWGYYKNGSYYITHICYQTKCTAGTYNFGQWPSWRPSPESGYVSPHWWGPYPKWGWDGGELLGGTPTTCPGHWYYTYDVNSSVNGVASAAGPGTFNVTKGGTSVGTGVSDYYVKNDIRAGTNMNVSDIAAKSGYVYVGNTSYSNTVNADTTVNLPFKTRYSLSFSKGSTNVDVSMPQAKSLVWDDDVTLPSVATDSGRTVDIVFDENKGAGSSTPTTATDIHDKLMATGWSIGGNTYAMGQQLDSPKFSSEPNGSVTATLQYQSKTYNLPSISREGYTFEGWYTSASGGDKVTSVKVDPSTGGYSQTLHAHWTPNTYTLTYDKNNPPTASVGESDIVLTPATSVKSKYDSTWGVLASASKPGYIFLGWFTEPDGGDRVTSDTKVKGNLTVYAHWRPIEYTIRFHPNAENGEGEVTGSMSSVKLTYDKVSELPANQYRKTTVTPPEDDGGESVVNESTFKGWNRNSLSLDTGFDDRAKVMNLTKSDGDVIDLYAIWDDAPNFTLVEYPDRFFTLEDAQNGHITEEELLKTVKVYDRETHELPKKTSEDVAEGDDIGVTIVGYDKDEWLSLTDDSVVSVRYQVKDEAGHTVYLNIHVTVTRNGALPLESVEYYRSISSDYREGLSDASRWRVDDSYSSKLDDALSGSAKTHSLYVSADELDTVREYVSDNGLGNSRSSNALSRLFDLLFRR